MVWDQWEGYFLQYEICYWLSLPVPFIWVSINQSSGGRWSEGNMKGKARTKKLKRLNRLQKLK